MIRLAVPTQPARAVFAKCISGKIDPELRKRLSCLLADIEQGETVYHELAQVAELFTIPRANLPDGISRKEISGVYTQRFVPKDSLGREIYDQLILSADNRTCPLCGIGLVESLDHYLPKRYWRFLVSPKNLVPSCLHCNKSKQDHQPDSFENQTIHPYYDDFQTHTWLRATIIENEPPGITYEVTNPENWDCRNVIRASTHFVEHDLANLFTSNAGNEISQNKVRFQDLFAMCGPNGLRDHLVNELNYCPRKNDWKTALYKALAESDWFHSKGCLLI